MSRPPPTLSTLSTLSTPLSAGSGAQATSRELQDRISFQGFTTALGLCACHVFYSEPWTTRVKVEMLLSSLDKRRAFFNLSNVAKPRKELRQEEEDFVWNCFEAFARVGDRTKGSYKACLASRNWTKLFQQLNLDLYLPPHLVLHPDVMFSRFTSPPQRVTWFDNFLQALHELGKVLPGDPGLTPGLAPSSGGAMGPMSKIIVLLRHEVLTRKSPGGVQRSGTSTTTRKSRRY